MAHDCYRALAIENDRKAEPVSGPLAVRLRVR
jgi:hypothetical protein